MSIAAFCGNCGQALRGAAYCGRCGTPAAAPSAAKAAASSALSAPAKWALVAGAVVVAVVASMALLKAVRPSAVSLAQLGGFTQEIDCVGDGDRGLLVVDGSTWRTEGFGGGVMSGTYSIDGDTVSVDIPQSEGGTMSVRISGLSNIQLDSGAPIVVASGGDQVSLDLDAGILAFESDEGDVTCRTK